MSSFIQIFAGSLILSIIHAAIPNHWLPLVAIAKAEKWTEKETLEVTAISGISHTLSTIIIGIIVGLIGYKLSESYRFITSVAAPAVLIVLGIIYLFIDYRENRKHHHHEHIDLGRVNRKSKSAIIFSFSAAMFFSPCIEIEAYYFVASRMGWPGILTVSAVYLIITVTGMISLVYIAGRGLEKLKLHFLEHHDKIISGSVLILLGITSFFIEY